MVHVNIHYKQNNGMTSFHLFNYVMILNYAIYLIVRKLTFENVHTRSEIIFKDMKAGSSV